MIRIVVYGTPAPQGSKKGFAIKRGGKFTGKVAMVESSAKVKPWREDVRAELCGFISKNALGDVLALGPGRLVGEGYGASLVFDRFHVPFNGPIRVRLTFTLSKPANAPKRTVTWPCKKPDIDKLARSTLDAIVSAGLIADDARVVDMACGKRYPNEGPDALDRPGCVIEITPIT